MKTPIQPPRYEAKRPTKADYDKLVEKISNQNKGKK